jgi:hypothetical protein
MELHPRSEIALVFYLAGVTSLAEGAASVFFLDGALEEGGWFHLLTRLDDGCGEAGLDGAWGLADEGSGIKKVFHGLRIHENFSVTHLGGLQRLQSNGLLRF